jgi:voltage-gated potassium channel
VVSVILVILESVPQYRLIYGETFYVIEWCLTAIFVLEYFLRVWVVQRPIRYIISFLGLVDFFSSFSTVLSLFIPGAQSLLVIRALRLLRIFRILKLSRYFSEGVILIDALKASRIKISVFLFAIVIIILISGTTMYLIEGPEAGFTSIPVSMYWAIVTVTTVGYGDIAPLTSLGRILASALMIVGYAIRKRFGHF